MYLLNALSLQLAQQLFIAVGRYRTGQKPVGVIDGVNTVFTTPGLEKFTHNLPFLSIHVYFNGVRQTLLDDFLVAESGGPGTGYDTILMAIPPKAGDKLLTDYVVTAP